MEPLQMRNFVRRSRRRRRPADAGYMTSVRPATLDEFADLNIEMVGFVNNHTGDYGWQGVLDTMNAAEKRHLIPCGVGRNLKEAVCPKFLDTANGRVGIVATSSTRSEAFAASDDGAGVAARRALIRCGGDGLMSFRMICLNSFIRLTLLSVRGKAWMRGAGWKLIRPRGMIRSDSAPYLKDAFRLNGVKRLMSALMPMRRMRQRF